MARIRSARKSEAPLRMQSRKTSEVPASPRICAAMSRTRAAISSALKTGLISLVGCTRPLHPHYVELSTSGTGHFEALRDFHAGHPDDLAVPDQEGEAVPDFGRDFTINQEIFELFRTGQAEG